MNHLLQIYLVNLDQINAIEEETIDIDKLKELKLISGKNPVKVLGNGTLKKKVTIKAHKISDSAKDKITKLKGEFIDISK